MKNQKLELMWIGKENQPKVEPRVLIEDKSKSYGDKNTENMLIHGDNLLALKALEDKFANKIKCIYIDPPYNTGSAFEYYDDNLEHSILLNLMQNRLKILYTLLSDDGAILVHLDDSEVHYLKVIMDDIFGRDNFISTIAVRSSTPSGVKTSHKDKTIIKQKDLILVYRKSDKLRIEPQYTKKYDWDTHYTYFLDRDKGKIVNLVDKLIEENIIQKRISLSQLDVEEKKFKDFYIKNKYNIFRTAPTMPEDIKKQSKENPNQLIEYEDRNGEMNYAINGNRCTFLDKQIHTLEDGEEGLSILLCDIWTDIDFQNTQNEGGNSFPGGKKPERLVRRILNMFSKEGDIVLDSFLGSGTTCAVAHKMKRKWIGIELGEHCYTHCKQRLDNIIDGNDQGGITSFVNWTGGGGYKFYELAPSLLVKDKFNNWIISENYNGELLSKAICKQEKFDYIENSECYWKQGKSSENDYIFITTNYISIEYLEAIHEEMQENESLLICCKTYQEECEDRYDNITIKKIPQSILNNCEYGKDDYSLNVNEVLEIDENE